MNSPIEIQVFVTHNNEKDRLDYLKKILPDFFDYMKVNGISAELIFVGPNVPEITNNKKKNSFYNRLIRAYYISKMHFMYDKMEALRLGRKFRILKHRFRFVRNIVKTFTKHSRSIHSEQETLFAHVHALNKARKFDGLSVIFESDIRLNEDTGRNFVDFLKYISVQNFDIPLYCDLAGGCERSSIMNSWAFGECQINKRINDSLSVHHLPILINNTAGGYLVNQIFAERFYQFLITNRTLCPVDFCFNLYAFQENFDKKNICIHSTPLIFQQGSAIGNYQSSPTLFE